MSVDVMLVVSLDEASPECRQAFRRAMVRRGWWCAEGEAARFEVGLHGVESDDDVVQICERDVQEAAYVAGAGEYEATCLINSE